MRGLIFYRGGADLYLINQIKPNHWLVVPVFRRNPEIGANGQMVGLDRGGVVSNSLPFSVSQSLSRTLID